MNHLEILQSTPAAQVGLGRDNLLIKTTGKFYTPKFIGERLVDSVLTVASRTENTGELSVIDPFCGDGRLIVWLLERVLIFPSLTNRSWRIEIWDCDEQAVIQAKQAIEKMANYIGINFTLSAFSHDSFAYFISQFRGRQTDNKPQFDITITNPPWEVIKPDRRDLERLDEQTESMYIESLRALSQKLKNNFPLSMPRKMFAGWGINLARIGLEVATHLTTNHGVTGIVSPISFLSDQNSEPLRKWLLTNHAIKYIDYFPSESRLFEGVDQTCVNITIQANNPGQKTFTYKFDKDLSCIEYHQELNLSESFLKSNSYVIPVYSNQSQLNHLLKFSELETLGDLQGNDEGQLWTGRELDETGHTSYLSLKGYYPFIKGKMIERLTRVNQPSMFIDPDKKLNIPPSVKYPRIVWRDVSRTTQKRRVQATIIPKNWVTGNSLGVAHFRTDNFSKLYTLLGIMSSLPFEFQVRSMLSTSHVSVGVLRKTRIPPITSELTTKLVPMIERKLAGNVTAEVEIEIVVAKAYGLDSQGLAEIMQSFPKLTPEECQNLLDHPMWRTS
ncbi:Alw26I/Eco31I/Esp3I family type II restriction adenine-specific DNA-methyltransferase [Dolichospermum flos-aquae]|uniref:site-specific DNA-methyltransferase (adenine-specific) n=1 Tax=Dolichospermum flos-aquae CCAP 1403/13F TaxID=315271 RepID=A0A6H2BWY2_DOLFA|nr:Alw26I/Eco31I/Esp3I family type II restriction adenine-specific DNA-methyltransferase [Dolichospermum flos-aquae]QJB43219.1 Alw26I/Eco31I/Esp3I family type II restriction adenine-specific DNA-methyltransferase [Dolichospermum flos-aquae CCAP 1403/13F]